MEQEKTKQRDNACRDEKSRKSSDGSNADFTIRVEGTIALFVPLTVAARAWLAEHCPADEEHHYFGASLAVGHRYVAGLIERAVDDGLTPMA